MIDTVRFKILVDIELSKQIELKGKSNIIKDNRQKDELLNYYKTDLPIASFNPNISIFSYDGKYIQLECSLPKQYNGENVTLLYPSRVLYAMENLYQKLKSLFPTFPPYKQWTIIRLDLCYAWRLSTQLQATQLLEMLKLLDYPRKFKYLYKTAVMYRGHHYSIKFYLKHDEYKRHDEAKLYEIDKDLANEIYQLSKGVIRFEITYRYQQLKFLFEKNQVTYLDLLNKDFLEKIMSDVISKLLQNRNKASMTDSQIIDKLKAKYKTEKAMRLFNFYKNYYSEQMHLKKMLKDNYHPSTIWRNIRDISLANVGISTDLLDFDFNLLIPSPLVVNFDKTVNARARTV